MNKECIILAGGLGTRLQSVVSDVPKCMATVAGYPFLSFLFNQLEKAQFTHVVLALGHKSEIVTQWLKNQNRSFAVSFVIEKEPLGTGGAIQFAFSKIRGDQALVLNGDTYFNIDINLFFNFHIQKGADISLALKRMEKFDRYGSVIIDNDNRINKFEDKRHIEEGLINGGIYLINRSILNKNSSIKKFSFEKEVLENLVKDIKIYGLPFESYFIDIGIPADYEKANRDFINFENISGQ